jgi:hypothetical protein
MRGVHNNLTLQTAQVRPLQRDLHIQNQALRSHQGVWPRRSRPCVQLQVRWREEEETVMMAAEATSPDTTYANHHEAVVEDTPIQVRIGPSGRPGAVTMKRCLVDRAIYPPSDKLTLTCGLGH